MKASRDKQQLEDDNYSLRMQVSKLQVALQREGGRLSEAKDRGAQDGDELGALRQRLAEAEELVSRLQAELGEAKGQTLQRDVQNASLRKELEAARSAAAASAQHAAFAARRPSLLSRLQPVHEAPPPPPPPLAALPPTASTRYAAVAASTDSDYSFRDAASAFRASFASAGPSASVAWPARADDRGGAGFIGRDEDCHASSPRLHRGTSIPGVSRQPAGSARRLSVSSPGRMEEPSQQAAISRADLARIEDEISLLARKLEHTRSRHHGGGGHSSRAAARLYDDGDDRSPDQRVSPTAHTDMAASHDNWDAVPLGQQPYRHSGGHGGGARVMDAVSPPAGGTGGLSHQLVRELEDLRLQNRHLAAQCRARDVDAGSRGVGKVPQRPLSARRVRSVTPGRHRSPRPDARMDLFAMMSGVAAGAARRERGKGQPQLQRPTASRAAINALHSGVPTILSQRH